MSRTVRPQSKIFIICLCLLLCLLEQQAQSEVIVEELFDPLDIGIGFESSWFNSKSFEADISSTTAADGEIHLRIIHKKKTSFQWVDHVPMFIKRGTYTISFQVSSNKRPINHSMCIELIRMKCDKKGKFSDTVSKKVATKNLKQNTCSINFGVNSDDFYIIRIKSQKALENFHLDIFNFKIYPFGSMPQKRIVQVAPHIEKVVYNLGEEVEIGASLHLSQACNCTLSCEIASIDGTKIKQVHLGSFTEPGVHKPSVKFVPKDYDFYIASYYLEGTENRFIQKSFSVLPGGDCSFMGLHAYSPKRNKKHLQLGRRLGFLHYRDHDMGRYTRWTEVQPCKKGTNCGLENPPPFCWDHDDSVKSIVKNLGYNYLGVLYDTPHWAKDNLRSIPSQSRYMPVIKPWRAYVRSTMQHYAGLIHDWEIWNEGKGVSGKRLNDPSMYIELLKASLEEANTVAEKNPDIKLNIVAFAGFNHKSYWQKTFGSVSGFNVVSSHIKAKTYQDTYYPVTRSDRQQNKKFSRDGWLKTAQKIVKTHGNNQELWDTEGGMLNQVTPVYSFFNLTGKNAKTKIGIPIADRTAHSWYKKDDPKSFSPISPMVSSAIMAKQTIAHKSSGISRLYMYYFSNRNFVSNFYAEQMLEYDSTLMPYTHAFIFCSKFLDNTKYVNRSFLPKTNLVKETFLLPNDKVVEVLWNEGLNKEAIKREKGKSYFTMMGRRILADVILINEYPVYISNSNLEKAL